MSLIDKMEPARSIGRLVAAIVGGAVVLTTALLQVLIAVFHVNLDGGAQAAIVAFITALTGILAPIVGAEETRDRVTPWDVNSGAKAPVGGPPIENQDTPAG